MAAILDIEEIEMGNGDLESLDVDVSPQPEPLKEVEPEPELPEKYRGKSVQDIVKMHQEAERLVGRQAQEVGEIRHLADQLIQSQLNTKTAEVKPEIDFFSNPEEAVRQAVSNSPELIEARNVAKHLKQQEAKRELLELHSDVGQIMSDPTFKEWVAASKVRTKIFQQAEAYDVEAADELLSTFKELGKARKTATEQSTKESDADKQSRTQSMRAAAVETGGSNESTRKVYRRADLIRLQIHNPAKYEAMMDEIQLAYAEDRVR